MSLRALLGGVAGVLLALALLSASALVVVSSRMEHSSVQLWQAVESLRAVEQLEISLLVHSRERRLLALTGDQAHAAAMERAQEQLLYWQERSRAFVGSAEEAALLAHVEEDVAEYLRLLMEQAVQKPLDALVGVPLVDRALLRSEQLIAVNYAQAHAVADEARAWNQLANTLGAVVGVALLLGVSLGMWSMRRYLYRPLLSIRQALVRFRPGVNGAAAPEVGPVELREIAQEFNAMAERLERFRAVQLRFIAGVAHDLRNPLAALKLGASAVRADLPLPPEEKLRERFGLISRQVERLDRMVGDLLDTAQIEAGQLELRLEEHDLTELVREAVALHQDLSPLHELVSQLPEEPVQVRCDATRMSQVLNNLLSNAIKYSPGGGQVRVELKATPEEVWVAVTDPGLGIPATEQAHIFEPFRRSASTRDLIPGVGMGLSVSRRIMEAHGGHIEVESTEGTGSTFRLRMPRQP